MTAAEHLAPHTVEADIDLRHTEVNGTHLPGRGAPTPAVLRWRRCDPWAVTLDFVDRGIVWTVGWELLADAAALGAAGRAIGDGDIRIARIHGPHMPFEIRLANQHGTATFTADPFDLLAFVDAVRPRQAAAVRPWMPDTAAELLDAIDAEADAR